MSKVINSSSRFDSAKYAILFFVFALLFINVLIVAFVFHAVRVNSEYKTRFEFDNLKFNVAMYNAISNYLDNFGLSLSGNSTNSVSSLRKLTPRVEIVEGCTWLTPRNYYKCLIEGVEYGVDDFTPYGLVFQITDGRIYCKDGEDIVVLRLKTPPASERPPLGGRSDMDRSLVKGPYPHNSENEDEN